VKRLKLLVEGQTEETFVRDILKPHYAPIGLDMTPILFSTRRGFKGGVTSYGKVKSQIIRLCREDRGAVVTTIIDLYGLPKDFPGKSATDYPATGTGPQKASFLETRLAADINERNFIPYLMVHEFEALLFTDPTRFGAWTDSERVVPELEKVTSRFRNPEDINDGAQTAPSKRIQAVMPGYDKAFHGPAIANDIGLDVIRARCGHFRAWLERLESLLR
jgi:hypothetical protein